MKFALPKLAVGGLGLSTLANAGGKTAEEMADIRTLLDQKNGAKMQSPIMSAITTIPYD